eukprot:5249696-Alexandrium_andersonii.AAC.1
MEHLTIVGSFTNGCGRETSRPASVPQGCSFSMLAVALLMQPWAVEVRKQLGSGVPRVLADDMGLSL